jgi:hypothetical protein
LKTGSREGTKDAKNTEKKLSLQAWRLCERSFLWVIGIFEALHWNILHEHLPFRKKRPAEKAGFAIGSPMILPIHSVSLGVGKSDHI